MRKLLIIIILIMAIFQMVVLATAIDIGSPAIERASAITTWTSIAKDNPANESGEITSIEIWAYEDLENCEVATFYVVSGNNLSTRDTHTIGSVTAGSKQTFSGLNLTCEAGDYIGIYYTAGTIYHSNTGGSGLWGLQNTDAIPCTNLTFGFFENEIMSLYGTGTTDINIGTPAIDRVSQIPYLDTMILNGSRANASGKIESIEIWVSTNMSDLEVATFYSTGVDEFSTRDTEYIGTVTAGAKRTFTVNLDVEAGDYIGFYATAGYIVMDATGGMGYWYLIETDGIPCTNTLFTFTSGPTRILSLYGRGTAVGANAIFFGTNF